MLDDLICFEVAKRALSSASTRIIKSVYDTGQFL